MNDFIQLCRAEWAQFLQSDGTESDQPKDQTAQLCGSCDLATRSEPGLTSSRSGRNDRHNANGIKHVCLRSFDQRTAVFSADTSSFNAAIQLAARKRPHTAAARLSILRIVVRHVQGRQSCATARRRSSAAPCGAPTSRPVASVPANRRAKLRLNTPHITRLIYCGYLSVAVHRTSAAPRPLRHAVI
jgi:hypothetical protein